MTMVKANKDKYIKIIKYKGEDYWQCVGNKKQKIDKDVECDAKFPVNGYVSQGCSNR